MARIGAVAAVLEGASGPVRPEVVAACDDAWAAIAAAGSWWTGEQRVAAAAEVRAAESCELCRLRRTAVSPYGVEGAHAARGPLPTAVVDAVHRLATDPGRLSTLWWEELQRAGIDDARHVEIVAVVAMTVAVDALCRALGLPPPELPAPVAGEPSREIAPGAEVHSSRWVRTVVPGKAEGPIKAVYDAFGAGEMLPNIARALTLVPRDALVFLRLSVALYRAAGRLVTPDEATGPLTRPQVELLAATTSAANDCFY